MCRLSIVLSRFNHSILLSLSVDIYCLNGVPWKMIHYNGIQKDKYLLWYYVINIKIFFKPMVVIFKYLPKTEKNSNRHIFSTFAFDKYNTGLLN